ncbi:MAG: hypothetical protein ACM34I_06480 [bacterium]
MKKIRISLILAVIFAFSLLGSAAFAAGLANDSVLSQHIKEADGTSGQDSNAGSGIKTGHIQDGAVTASKIAYYSKVAIVAPVGGDFTNPASALGSVTSWCGTPSETNRCLVKIMPGIYDVNWDYVNGRAYVDIEGSGENTTIITGRGSYTVYGGNEEIRFLTIENRGDIATSWARAIRFDNSSGGKLTNVTATCSGASQMNWAIETAGPATLINVTAIASGGSQETVGILLGNGSATLRNVTVAAQDAPFNYGIFVKNGAPILNSVTAKATGGSYNYGVYNEYSFEGDPMRIYNSILAGSTNTIFNGEIPIWPTTTYIATTHLDGGPVAGIGTTVCAGVYDENFNFSTNTCP